MTRIGRSIPSTSVKKFRNRNVRIEAKKAEINRINELLKEGLIDKDEAERKISILENQIKELEFNVPNGESDVEIDVTRNQPTELGAPLNDSLDMSNMFDGNDSPKEHQNSEYGKDDFYSSQANILKAVHGLV